MKGGGVFILIPATEKEQESEIPKNAGVFQVLLVGIVADKQENLLPGMDKSCQEPNDPTSV